MRITTSYGLGLFWLLASCSSPDAFAPSAGTVEQPVVERTAQTSRLRIMAANLTSGTGQSYSEGHGARILGGADPDVVLIQEFNAGTSSPTDIRAFVDSALGPNYGYFRESGEQLPNGIISRYPIIASGAWADSHVANRNFAWARIDVPGPTDLWAVSVHLLTTASSERAVEAEAVVQHLRATVPLGSFIAIGGDLNTRNRTEACIVRLGSVVVTSGPFPVDRNGNDKTNRTRNRPYDWVLVSPNLGAYQTATVIGATPFTNGTVLDTRVYAPVADIAPAFASDSNATNMQHMGVVRDFAIPLAPEPETP